MRYLIIGLGIFGSNLARDLAEIGNEVIGADSCAANIEPLKDVLTTVYCIDSTDEAALSVLPLTNVDIVVVAIGESFGASVRTVALLKKAGVKHIYARSTDDIHRAILEGFNVDRILNPERRAAADLTDNLQLGPDSVSMTVDADHIVASIALPQIMEGMDYDKLILKEEYGLTLVAVSRNVKKTNIIGVSHTVRQVIAPEGETAKPGDIITVFGEKKQIRTLYRETR